MYSRKYTHSCKIQRIAAYTSHEFRVATVACSHLQTKFHHLGLIERVSLTSIISSLLAWQTMARELGVLGSVIALLKSLKARAFCASPDLKNWSTGRTVRELGASCHRYVWLLDDWPLSGESSVALSLLEASITCGTRIVTCPHRVVAGCR